MLFRLLLSILDLAIGIGSKRNKAMKDMIKSHNQAFVIMTRDSKIGRRFIFKNGRYSSDKVLTEYDMALVFESAADGFKALALGGDDGIQNAINDWKLRILGDDFHIIWFGVIMQMALGASKRK
ncbi:MAG: hypothetical protein JW901_00180 [Dehalococcoidia bacterium]|nr:hypothetical protein [Dehalococcoidia bacterium]